MAFVRLETRLDRHATRDRERERGRGEQNHCCMKPADRGRRFVNFAPALPVDNFDQTQIDPFELFRKPRLAGPKTTSR